MTKAEQDLERIKTALDVAGIPAGIGSTVDRVHWLIGRYQVVLLGAQQLFDALQKQEKVGAEHARV